MKMATEPSGSRHIAIDARSIDSTTGTVLRKLLPLLEAQDRHNRYTIIVHERDAAVWTPHAPNFAVMTTDAGTWSLATQTRLVGVLRRLTPDLVWFFMPEQPLLYRGRTLTTFFDLTMIKTPPTEVLRRRKRLYAKLLLGRFVFRLAARASDRIMVSARATQNEVARRYGLPAKKFALVHCGADVDPGTTTPYPHPFGRFLLYVGQHGWHKNVERLCDAHQRLLARHPDLGLILVGKIDRQTEVTRDHVAHHGYRNIHFTGFLPDAQRDWLYEQAAAYVFPSLLEGFGLPGVEAMAYGTPVISSNATCLPEIYGEAAHYFDPEDTGDMVRAIEEVLVDPALAERLRTRGPDQAARYSYARMAREMLALFDEAIADGRRPG